MPAARSVAILFFSAAFIGCSLNWSSRADDPDAGPSDAGGEARPPFIPVPPGDSGDESDGSNVDCLGMSHDLDAKKQLARACSAVGAPGECQTFVRDECNCKVIVKKASAETTEYDDAVQRFVASGCPTGCAASCPTPNADTIAQNAWTCGPTLSCYP